MKPIRPPHILFATLLALAPLVSRGDTFFTDDFSHGSTTNDVSIPGGTPGASFTSYDLASSKNATESSLSPSLFSCRLTANTTSGYWEAQALFTTNVVALVTNGDYIDVVLVFTNSAGTLFTGTASPIWIGLYNSHAPAGTINPPVAGALANAGLNTTSGSVYALGNCQLWEGYFGQVYTGAAGRIYTRPVQDGPDTTSANQELLGNGVSGGTFKNPKGTQLASSAVQTFTLDTNSPYTVELQITLDPAGSGDLIITNVLYSGVGTGGTVLFTNGVTTTPITSAFDGLAFGAFNHNGSFNPQMDVSSITITGHSTPPPPPTISQEPASVTVPAGAACAFDVVADGVGLTYQWHRYGTNLVDGGSISGSTSPMLIVSPASAADVASGANGYYVTITGAGNLSTNSQLASLALGTGKNLTWAGPGSIWDLNTSANWQDSGGNPSVFNFGDSVTFNGGGPGGVTLSGSFLSASSMTVTGGTGYQFLGSGSFAGPGKLIFTGSFLDIANVNTYTGGTIISNSAALLYLENYRGLGLGPVTFAQAGGSMEIVPTGSSSSGIAGDLVVADNFLINYDATNSSYAAVFLGNLSGTAGKTLTIAPIDPSSTATRVRLYGENTAYAGNLNLANGNMVWASYQASGTQAYNGVISGSGAFMMKGKTPTYLNGANTYSGGTLPVTGSLGLGNNSALGTGPILLTVDSTTTTTGSGELFASDGARSIANAIQYPSGSNNLTLVIGGTNDLTFSGPFTLNGADGGTVYTNRIVEVNNTAMTTLSGVISDGGAGFSFTKTGTGVLALNNAETYSGQTYVNDGTMLVNGQLPNSAVTVTGATLGGSGSILGPVTIASGAVLSPGNGTAVATLAVNNSLTLNGNVVVDINKSLYPAATNDSVTVSGALTGSGSGAITVNNLGPALAVGDKFYIFSKALTGGGSMIVTGAGAVWNNNLALDGSISVASTTIPRPVVTSTTLLSGNTGLVMNGTNGVAGLPFYVLSTTDLTQPISSWTLVSTNVFGAGGGFSVTNPISAGNPQTFFILQMP